MVTLSGSLKELFSTQQYVPIINLFSLLVWATATFWLPLLFMIEIWRHVKAGFNYSAGYWSMVFPLGMYTVATVKLAAVLQVPHYSFRYPHGFIFIALIAWLTVFIGDAEKKAKSLAG